jgi:hypothetical protein
MEDRIVELLGAGVLPSVVAQTVGCDPSYISQLMGREEIAAKVAELRMAKTVGMVEHDGKIQDFEELALQKIGTLLPMQNDIMKVTRVFQVLNGARRSAEHNGAGAPQQPGTVVTLNLPAAAHVEFKLTTDGQVVEVAGRSMVPMPSHQVSAQLRARQAARLLEHSQAAPTQPVISARTKSIVDML